MLIHALRFPGLALLLAAFFSPNLAMARSKTIKLERHDSESNDHSCSSFESLVYNMNLLGMGAEVKKCTPGSWLPFKNKSAQAEITIRNPEAACVGGLPALFAGNFSPKNSDYPPSVGKIDNFILLTRSCMNYPYYMFPPNFFNNLIGDGKGNAILGTAPSPELQKVFPGLTGELTRDMANRGNRELAANIVMRHVKAALSEQVKSASSHDVRIWEPRVWQRKMPNFKQLVGMDGDLSRTDIILESDANDLGVLFAALPQFKATYGMILFMEQRLNSGKLKIAWDSDPKATTEKGALVAHKCHLSSEDLASINIWPNITHIKKSIRVDYENSSSPKPRFTIDENAAEVQVESLPRETPFNSTYRITKSLPVAYAPLNVQGIDRIFLTTEIQSKLKTWGPNHKLFKCEVEALFSIGSQNVLWERFKARNLNSLEGPTSGVIIGDVAVAGSEFRHDQYVEAIKNETDPHFESYLYTMFTTINDLLNSRFE